MRQHAVSMMGLVLLAVLVHNTAIAADVVVKLSAGDGFVVQDSGGTEQLRVDESGNILKGGQLFLHDVGVRNTFVGKSSGNPGVTGDNNAAFGQGSMSSTGTGSQNAAFGSGALASNVGGGGNVAFGMNALQANIGASDNSALGRGALTNNISGFSNVAVGKNAMFSSQTGDANTAVGTNALFNNDGQSNNSAFGANALFANTTGGENAAFGSSALNANMVGHRNSGFGTQALWLNVAGSDNAALGQDALRNNTTGSNNIALGSAAGINQTTGGNNIYLGSGGVAAETGQIRIGTSGTQTNVFIAGIDGNAVTGMAVLVTSSGELGVAVSSNRFKEAVRDMGEASGALMKMRPVSFRYRAEIDGGEKVLQYGLIAEEVAEVDPNLVVFDGDGQPFAVRYQFLAPMLLNEAQNQQRTIDEQRQMIAALAERVERLESRSGAQQTGADR